MVTAIVLLKVERHQINAVATQLTTMNGISEVFSVAGRYDLVAILRVPTNQAMANVVTEQMSKVDAIVDSATMIAFKAFSQHDLEAMFEVGF